MILEREEGREKNINVREKYRCEREPLSVASHMHPCNPGLCPDRELNPQPFGVKDDAPTN